MKKKYSLLLCLILLGGLYNLWTLRPVNILYVYADAGLTMEIVVDHMPWTDRDKIAWFLARRDALKKEYPLLDREWHSYYIIDIGDGFTNYKKKPHEDLRCFPDIKSENSCLIKDYFLTVHEYPGRNTRFYIPFGDYEYQLTPGNKIEFFPRPAGWRE